jgi:hypothetical protein
MHACFFRTLIGCSVVATHPCMQRKAFEKKKDGQAKVATDPPIG